MADEGAPQLTIVTRFETDSSGADQAVADLGKIKDTATDAGAGITNSLDNRRAVTHALRGLMELREGGTMALAGLASEAFVATEAFETMLGPLAPFLLTLSLIASIGIPMFERMRGAVKENKTAEEDLGKASEEASKKRIEAIGAVISKFGEAVKAEMAYNEELTKEAQYTQKEFDDTEKLITAKTKLAVQELELQRQVALGHAKTAEEVTAINERYKNLIEGTKSQGDAQVLDAKINASAQDIADKEGERRRAQEELAPLEQERQSHRDATRQAQDEAAALGVNPDATGSYADVAKDLGKQLDAAIKASEADPRNQDKKHLVDDLGAKQAAANKANDYTEGLKKWEEVLNPPIDKLSAQVEALSSAIATARADNQILQIEQQGASVAAKTATLAEQQAAAKEAAKTAFEEFKAEKENDIKAAQTKKGDPNLSADDKAALEARIDGLQAQIADYQLQHAGPNELDLSEPEKTTLRGDIRADQGKAVHAIGSQQQKSETAALKREIDELKKQLAARPDHESLKPFIAAAERQGDLATEAAQLQSLANQVIGAFVTAQTARNAQQEQFNEKTRQDIARLKGQVNSNRTNRH